MITANMAFDRSKLFNDRLAKKKNTFEFKRIQIPKPFSVKWTSSTTTTSIDAKYSADLIEYSQFWWQVIMMYNGRTTLFDGSFNRDGA
jgi:hypothetical protein